MRHVILCVALAAALASPARAIERRGGTEAQYAEIEAIAARWFEAYAAGDADAVAEIYDVNTRIMSEGDPSRTGNVGLRERLTKAFQTTKMEFANEIEEIEIGGDLAFIAGLFAAKTSKADTEPRVNGGRYFIVLRQTDAGWKVWRDIDNATPDADPLIAKMKGLSE